MMFATKRLRRRPSAMRLIAALSLMAVVVSALSSLAVAGERAAPAEPLVIGQSFEIRSAILDETRRINVYFPPGFTAAGPQPLPVLYMPDGGMGEDFLHIAGLIQVSVGNNTMRPWILVGIENTERRRDLTGPTDDADDRKIAKHVGGSQCFRDFIRKELMPAIRVRYRTTEETGIVGESLAGLFVVETFLLEPDLFAKYVAIDPSLWWNRRGLVEEARSRLTDPALAGKSLYVATSRDADATDFRQLLDARRAAGSLTGFEYYFRPYPEETHATVYHPAAVTAFRAILSTPGVSAHGAAQSATSATRSLHLVDGACVGTSPH